jgi:hypothetical protein
LNNSKLQARAERLNRRISVEEAHSGGSREHIKLLREYEETVNTQIMRNMQAGMTMSMEIITTLEEKIKIYKVDLAQHRKINLDLLEVIKVIKQDNSKKEDDK